jgi:hypothetical protein
VIRDGLTISLEYRVRYRAKNIFGWSEYSAVTSIYTIMVPDVTPDPLSITLIGTNVVFNWDEPAARGTPITYYNVQVQSHDGSFIVHPDYCHEVTLLTCSFPMTTLSDSTGLYQLPLSELIIAQVAATNA